MFAGEDLRNRSQGGQLSGGRSEYNRLGKPDPHRTVNSPLWVGLQRAFVAGVLVIQLVCLFYTIPAARSGGAAGAVAGAGAGTAAKPLSLTVVGQREAVDEGRAAARGETGRQADRRMLPQRELEPRRANVPLDVAQPKITKGNFVATKQVAKALQPSISPWSRSVQQHGNSKLTEAVMAELGPALVSDLLQLCGRCLYHTITTAVALRGLGEDAHVGTGDIPDMWLRDSAFEVSIYMPRMASRPAFRRVVEGTIRRQAFDISMDPYACGFSWKWWDPNHEVTEDNRREGRGGWVAIRSFEIDSGAYFMNLLWDYYNTPGLYDPASLIGETLIHDAVSYMVNTYIVEQEHSSKSPYLAFDLANNGKGTPVAHTGMVWSGYRPSDDKTQYGYNIPGNMIVAGALERMAELNKQVWTDEDLGRRIEKLLSDIQGGLEKHAIVERDGERIYAYEVDGMGHAVVDFDDPNLPSLMSIPLLGYQHYNESVYQATRRRLFTKNPFYFKGRAFSGFGSPHTPSQYVWHLGWITEGLTSSNPVERAKLLRNLLAAQCGNGLMHESVNVHQPNQCTRKWFEWANALMVVFVENSLGKACDPHADAEFAAQVMRREATSNKALHDAKFYENFEQHIHHAFKLDSTKLMNMDG